MWCVRKNEVQLLLRLEAELERDDEGAVDLCQHQSLRESVRDFIPVHFVKARKLMFQNNGITYRCASCGWS